MVSKHLTGTVRQGYDEIGSSSQSVAKSDFKVQDPVKIFGPEEFFTNILYRRSLLCLGEDSVALVGVSNFFKEYEINQEASSHQHSLHFNIHVQGELDAKVVCISEHLL